MIWQVREQRRGAKAYSIEAPHEQGAAAHVCSGRGYPVRLMESQGGGVYTFHYLDGSPGLTVRVWLPQSRTGGPEDRARNLILAHVQARRVGGVLAAEFPMFEADATGRGIEAAGRADLFHFRPDGTVFGWEIKTAEDNLSRLARQWPLYAGSCEGYAVAVAPIHLAGADAILPPSAGLAVILPDGIETVRPCSAAGYLPDVRRLLLGLNRGEVENIVRKYPHLSQIARPNQLKRRGMWRLCEILAEFVGREHLIRDIGEARAGRTGGRVGAWRV